MAKSFVKVFLICLVLFTLILIPVIKLISNIQIFDNSGISGGIEDEIDVLVDPNSPFFEAFADAKRVNLLALGINDGLSDVLMLVSWDMDENKVDLISVPRDTYYEREGYTSPGQKKINAAYASKEGLISTANAVSDVLMGIPINYYAIIDYDAVETIVDGVGGVTVDVPKAMKYDDPYDDPPLHISIPAGVQTLDGEHAVQYLRFRKGYSNGDIGRIEAQQVFMESLFKQCIDHGIVDSAKLITSNVKSDITLGAASKYALKAMGLESGDITTYTLPGEGQYIDGTSYYIQDEAATEEMLREIYQVTPEDGGDADSDSKSK